MSSDSYPEIYGYTDDLLKHLQSDGAQDARQLEKALGDVDQISTEQVEEWRDWAIGAGFVEETGGGRYNITQAGQRKIGPPR